MPTTTFTTQTESEFDQRIIENAAGVRVSVLANGCPQWIMVGPTMVNLFVGQPLSGGAMRVLIRKHEADAVRYVEAVGPQSTAEVAAADNAIRWRSKWGELFYIVEVILHDDETAWAWRVTLDTSGSPEAAGSYDAILVQDIGLAGRGQVQNNEAYTSQYLDHQIFDHPTLGPVIATRQNLAQHDGQHPQLLTACTGGAAGAITDAFDFFGPAYRAGGDPLHATTPVIPTRNRQYEFASHTLQSHRFNLTVGETATAMFVCRFVADHPEASSADKAIPIDPHPMDDLWDTQGEFQNFTERAPQNVSPHLLNGEPLDAEQIEEWFGPTDAWRQVERNDGEIASFFYTEALGQAVHVVLPAKELRVDRRHAHLYKSGWDVLPGGQTLCNTAYASGIFASHVCLGNTSFNKLLSVSRDPLNLLRYAGLRLFVRLDGDSSWRQLGCASAFAMKRGGCEWTYRLPGGRRLWVFADEETGEKPMLRFDVRPDRGKPIDLRMTAHLVVGDREHDQPIRVEIDAERQRVGLRAAAGLLVERYPEASWSIHFTQPLERLGGDELLRVDGARRGWPILVAEADQTMGMSWQITGRLGPPAEKQNDLKDRGGLFMDESALHLDAPGSPAVSRLAETLPWFDHNAAIHLTAPHGIEQYGGAAWGVRDVCQGPVEWLLARGEFKAVERILEDVFSHQYEDTGAWPQWYMHPPFENIQSDHSHGDVAVWPIIAIVNALAATGDMGLLDREAPYTKRMPPFAFTQSTATIRQHVELAIEKLKEKFIPGTSLLSYGDGDWNDSLQPAQPGMRESMVSTWTVELFYQALRGWAGVLRQRGEDAAARKHDDTADAIRADFNRLLVVDDETVGLYLHDDDPDKSRLLLHPRDNETGVKHRLLPMIRGIISEVFTSDQAQHHATLIAKHLLAPDGARLMDRPPHYTGGTMRHFQRLESASFFGREIGLMYTHAHLRYAEAMAKLGHARELFEALEKINPVGTHHAVPNAAPRQANCYFSSSDAAFLNRADSEERYEALMRGEVPVHGGWRVYSSGPGITIGLIVRQWLGLRRDFGRYIFDPVLSAEHDGLVAAVPVMGKPCTVTFHVSGGGNGVEKVTLDGETLKLVGRDDNPYRTGGLCVDAEGLRDRLAGSDARLEVWC